MRDTSYQAVYTKFKLFIQGKCKVIFHARNRPRGQRMIKLLWPGDVKGMHILIQSRSEMYIYLPAFRKVRRIAGHVRNQGFLGSDFNYDDMAISTWSTGYDVQLSKETKKHYWLDLRAKPGKAVPYFRVAMRIRKDWGVADTFRFFNRRGKNTKTQKYSNFKCRSISGHCMPMTIQMINHNRGNRISELRAVKLKYPSAYPDRMFTIRHLLRNAN
ncbi:MAG: outer membrane lipoprotein-sorting protein [bacterium]